MLIHVLLTNIRLAAIYSCKIKIEKIHLYYLILCIVGTSVYISTTSEKND